MTGEHCCYEAHNVMAVLIFSIKWLYTTHLCTTINAGNGRSYFFPGINKLMWLIYLLKNNANRTVAVQMALNCNVVRYSENNDSRLSV